MFQANSTSDPGRDLLQSPCVQPPSRCGEILSLWIPLSPPSHPISHWSDWFVQLTELIVAFSFSLWFFDLCLMILFFISLVPWFILIIAPCILFYIFTSRPGISWIREGSGDGTFLHRNLREPVSITNKSLRTCLAKHCTLGLF